ncbi:HK97 family phage prohead protease [Streptomyces sp. CL7]|uniref:HK97 family phage prohead protease n=1 Tax=Streptomyces sp. CL7 TaxID=3096006 RepID=UPI002A763474|nr:HK97 family phage prohead protease [Streptomyces sp. CL7]WPP30034.1 HK97 family phage prohead protease [Streptomyces sp. CL7]
MQTVARELERSAPFQLLRAEGEDGEGDGRTLSGYAAVFGEPTEINSWEGVFTETIRKGAFKKTIRENTPVMQFDHGRHPLIGSIPIGAIVDLREDDQGLFVEGRITDNWLMQPIRDAIAEQTVNGMSFRFEVVREEWRDVNGKLVKPEEVYDLLWMPGDRGPLQRELIEVRMRELGPVVFPAYVGTSVSVRARDMAAGLVSDDRLTRQIRASLARDAATTAPQVPDDPQLRREVAAALLYEQAAPQTREAAPPSPGHPDPARTTGAPADEGHPPTPSTTDAPPSDGHPSPPPTSQGLRSEISERLAFMRTHLASIEDKDI